jgi:hypothetical protein
MGIGGGIREQRRSSSTQGLSRSIEQQVVGCADT